ncbi:MAG: hypothetical protein PHP57_13420 [Sideroxydans sp.]|nr:hypothetical protein [Sideroxydans sp.]
MGITPQSLLQLGAAGNNAIGAYYSANTQRSNLNTQAALSDINAAQAEKAAQSALNAGQMAESAQLLRTQQIKSGQRVAMAANGIDLGVGSAAINQTSTEVMGQADALTINANAVQQANAYRKQAANFQIDAMMKRSNAKGINPNMAVFTSLMSDASGVASKWQPGAA